MPKISDFGFMRDVASSVYVMMHSSVGQCSLPYQWMAPEVLREEEADVQSIKFDTKTDVVSLSTFI